MTMGLTRRSTLGLDVVVVVRGASRGFTVLLLGGVVQPWIGTLVPPLGAVWLTLVAVTAFTWAAWPRGAGWLRPRLDRGLHGVAAALGSYLLVLPLVLSAAGFIPWIQVAFTAASAVVSGGLTGALAEPRPSRIATKISPIPPERHPLG